jgi:hypothetical protein
MRKALCLDLHGLHYTVWGVLMEKKMHAVYELPSAVSNVPRHTYLLRTTWHVSSLWVGGPFVERTSAQNVLPIVMVTYKHIIDVFTPRQGVSARDKTRLGMRCCDIDFDSLAACRQTDAITGRSTYNVHDGPSEIKCNITGSCSNYCDCWHPRRVVVLDLQHPLAPARPDRECHSVNLNYRRWDCIGAACSGKLQQSEWHRCSLRDI